MTIEKQTSAILEFVFRFRFLPISPSLACHSVSDCQISSKSGHLRRSYFMTSCRFTKWQHSA